MMHMLELRNDFVNTDGAGTCKKTFFRCAFAGGDWIDQSFVITLQWRDRPQ